MDIYNIIKRHLELGGETKVTKITDLIMFRNTLYRMLFPSEAISNEQINMLTKDQIKLKVSKLSIKYTDELKDFVIRLFDKNRALMIKDLIDHPWSSILYYLYY